MPHQISDGGSHENSSERAKSYLILKSISHYCVGEAKYESLHLPVLNTLIVNRSGEVGPLKNRTRKRMN